MARSLWNGAIAFGLVNIPVSLASAEERADIELHLVDSKNHARIRNERVNAERFVAPQLARVVPTVPTGGQWLHEIKFDGYRLLAVQRDGKLRLFTRNELDWTHRFTDLARHLSALSRNDFVMDGEVVVFDDKGRSRFGELQAALQSGRCESITYVAFDLLHLDGRNLRDLPLSDRLHHLAELVSDEAGPVRRSTTWPADAGRELFTQACANGLEGIVSKNANGRYLEGSRREWVKSKCRARQEFVVCGYLPLLFLRAFLRKGSPIRSRKVRRRIWAELLLIVSVWSVILSAVAWFHVWRFFQWMYLLPSFVAGNLQSWRKYIEHVGLTGDTVISSTRSVVAHGWAGKLFAFSLLHEPFHGVHHLHMALPHPELPHHASELTPQTPEEIKPFPNYRRALQHLLRALGDPRVGAQWRSLPN